MLNGLLWPRPRGDACHSKTVAVRVPHWPTAGHKDTRAWRPCNQHPVCQGRHRHGKDDRARVRAQPGDIASQSSGAGCFLTAFSPTHMSYPTE